MCGLEIFYVILAIYIVGLGLGVAFAYAGADGPNTSGWVKVIFWPITVLIFLLGIILWLSIWVPINLVKGILLCFDEIGDFFINIYSNAIGEKD